MQQCGDGNILWQKSFQDAESDSSVSHIATTEDGMIFVAGSTHYHETDIWVSKLDSDGNPVWVKVVGGSSADWAVAGEACSDGGLAVVGRTDSFAPSGSIGWLIKLSADGNLLWQKAIGNGSDPNGSILFVGESNTGKLILGGLASGDHTRPLVAILSSTGEVGGTCSLIQETHVTALDSSAVVHDPEVTLSDTDAIAQDSGALVVPLETPSTTIYLCPE